VPPQVLSRPDGGFVFSGLVAGEYRLEAAKQGVGKTREPRVAHIGSGEAEEIVLRLNSTGTIRGRILGLSLAELAQAQLLLGWGPLGVGQVAHDGTYEIPDVAPGTWRVAAHLPRSGRQAEGEVTVDPAAGDAYLDLDFGGGLTLSGLVRHDGQPLPGAALVLFAAGGAPATSASDSGGRFVFEGLARGLYRLEVSDSRARLRHARELELAADEALVLDLATGSVTGVVVDARDRRPVAGAEVTLAQEGSGPGAGDPRAITTADGMFAFPEVVEGSWRVVAEKSGYAPASRAAMVEAGQPVEVEIPLEPSGGASR
jgi:hypothetical protein